MYIVILVLLPVIMALSRLGRWPVFAFMGALWLGANLKLLGLPAEPWSDRVWFFNPFAWQLLFFTGFAYMRGWIPAPPVRHGLILAALAVVLLTVPFAWFRVCGAFPVLLEVRNAIEPLWAKTEFGFLRYVHVLALAYLAWVAVGAGGRFLVVDNAWGAVVRVIQKVGQQSLAVFLASLVVAQAVGILRDMVWGRGDMLIEFLANAGGFAVLIAVAYVVSWYKKEPWRRKGPPHGPAGGTSADRRGAAQPARETVR